MLTQLVLCQTVFNFIIQSRLSLISIGGIHILFRYEGMLRSYTSQRYYIFQAGKKVENEQIWIILILRIFRKSFNSYISRKGFIE